MKGPAVDGATSEAVHKGVFLILLATFMLAPYTYTAIVWATLAGWLL